MNVSKFHQSSQPSVKVEFRLAETRPDKELKEDVVPGSGIKVYLHKEVVVTNLDILEARVIPDESEGTFGVFVIFTAAGAGKMVNATKVHLNKPLAIFVDGRLVAAPQVKSIIKDRTAITGRFTRDEAEKIARVLSLKSTLDSPSRSNEVRVRLELHLAERVPAEWVD
jgi:preprotein translocase subunit SecD